jgi:hypothetical protein
MLFTEFEQVSSSPDVVRPDPLLTVTGSTDNICVVDGLYPFPLEATSTGFPRGAAIPVVDESGASIGELLTCAGEEYALPRFSGSYVASYLSDVTLTTYGQVGHFLRDYFVVDERRADDYRARYLEGSAVWGGFEHYTGHAAPNRETTAEPIRAVQNITYSIDSYRQAAQRSVLQPFAFERFLKLYHLLELSFDLHIVTEIRGLGNDLVGIGQIFSNLNSKEMHRLKTIIGTCRDPGRIVECIAKITADPRWHNYIKVIFFDFSKEGNPLASKSAAFLDALTLGRYSITNMGAVAGIPSGNNPRAQQEGFEAFSLTLAAYWIYRVRSCIAHNRVGEYVMQNNDEPFIIYFAEPLIRCVLTELL